MGVLRGNSIAILSGIGAGQEWLSSDHGDGAEERQTPLEWRMIPLHIRRHHGQAIPRAPTSYFLRIMKFFFGGGPFYDGCASTKPKKYTAPGANEMLFKATTGALAGKAMGGMFGVKGNAGAMVGGLAGATGNTGAMVAGGVGAKVGGWAGKKFGKHMAPMLGLTKEEGEMLGKAAGMAAGAAAATKMLKSFGSGKFQCSKAAGNYVTPNVLSSWAYHYGQNAVKASEEARLHAAHAEEMVTAALAARGQAEAAMYEAKLVARSQFTRSDGSIVPFYHFCDEIKDYYNTELVGPHQWLRKEPAMVKLRKFCAGMEYTVDRELGNMSAADLQSSGMHMYRDPQGDFCAEPDCTPAFAREVPTFYGESYWSAEDVKRLGIKRPSDSEIKEQTGERESGVYNEPSVTEGGVDEAMVVATCVEKRYVFCRRRVAPIRGVGIEFL